MTVSHNATSRHNNSALPLALSYKHNDDSAICWCNCCGCGSRIGGFEGAHARACVHTRIEKRLAGCLSC